MGVLAGEVFGGKLF